jgi:5-(carboxyamino)imidazole ribonucleotide mutase
MSQPATRSPSRSDDPLVGIIMGSDSDLPVMQAAADALTELGVPFEMTIVSAHRTPQRLYDYAAGAVERGLKVIIAGAGGAAHLPGMAAAISPLPVIGVPVKSRALSGQDSLLSIVQMPPGVPVATVAIDGARNAGLLAAQILAAMNSGWPPGLALQRPQRPARRPRGCAGADPGGHRLLHHRRRRPKVGPLRLLLHRRGHRLRRRAPGHDLGGHRRPWRC